MPKENYKICLQDKQNKPQRGPGVQLNVEKAKDFNLTIKKIINYIKKKKSVMLVAMIFAMLGSILTLIGPSQLKKLTDTITEGIKASIMNVGEIDINNIYFIVLFLIIIYVLSYIFSITQGIMISTIMQKTAKNLRTDISNKINRLPMNYFSKKCITLFNDY